MVVVFSLEKVQEAQPSQIEKSSGLGGNVISSIAKKEKRTTEQGNLLNEALNQGLASFTPDLLYEHIVKSYSSAKKLLGPRLLRFLSGFSSSLLEKNVRIPEFRKELKKRIESKVDDLKGDGFLDKDGQINPKGVELASVMLAVQELDKLAERGLLPSKKKSLSTAGEVVDYRNFLKGDSYKDIAVRKSVHSAAKRLHRSVQFSDLRSKIKKSKGIVSIVYALDASASMRGGKISMAKRAGVALAYKAIEEKDKVGLVVFNQDVSKALLPCSDFQYLLKNIVDIRAFSQTDFGLMINKAVELFSDVHEGKHLMILTDALPTVGKDPEAETLKAISKAKANDITVSLIGINLDKKGATLAEKIVQLGEGRLYLATNLEDLDMIVLEDYLSFG